jgi:hypothetical protein
METKARPALSFGWIFTIAESFRNVDHSYIPPPPLSLDAVALTLDTVASRSEPQAKNTGRHCRKREQPQPSFRRKPESSNGQAVCF